MEVLTEVVPGSVDVYEAALANPALVAQSRDIAIAFDALRTTDPEAPEVRALSERLVAAAGELPVPAAPAHHRIVMDDVTSWFDVADWLSGAQRRCIALMMEQLHGLPE